MLKKKMFHKTGSKKGSLFSMRLMRIVGLNKVNRAPQRQGLGNIEAPVI